METTQDVQQSAERIGATDAVVNASQELNDYVTEIKKKEKTRSRGPGTLIQETSPQTQSDYGYFLPMEDVRMDNDVDDAEFNKVDVFVRGSKPSAGQANNHWSNVVSFLGVKAAASDDVTKEIVSMFAICQKDVPVQYCQFRSLLRDVV
ncbi:hypothetical protein BCV69DRAFT_300204 [Microstroma glucosiphilum]|uniref:Uncharacterized protein n=1 Tax=Pseudomicrostroma glucosiphilum TaxID=1684307 RepID=A0A316U2E2_9BASI|nr:hypothetical protein BCV69DRAFT_300204 [Pseudomicrostroma glucosiphilum]PWN19370.1 hypothetical protein BCV69DRAFT_300204 [Pseudomicrostroma glucosiphilum]